MQFAFHPDHPIILQILIQTVSPLSVFIGGCICLHLRPSADGFSPPLIHPYPIILHLDNNRVALEPRLDPDLLIISPNSTAAHRKRRIRWR